MALVTEAQVQRAIDYMMDKEDEASVARADAKSQEKRLSVVESEMRVKYMADGNGVGAAEAKAKASDEYKRAIDDYKEALAKAFRYEQKIEASKMIIELYRTESANNRKGI
jgi:hypothetical protein